MSDDVRLVFKTDPETIEKMQRAYERWHAVLKENRRQQREAARRILKGT